MSKTLVITIGGNALTSKKRTFDSQYTAVKEAVLEIAKLAKDYHLVITHGNGPQVGDALLRNELAQKTLPPLPLYACVAQTQGMIGTMIQAALRERLGNYTIASLATKVTVAKDDPAFSNPTKPIGMILRKQDTVKIKKLEPTASFKEITPNKFRRVVASPKPISIVELDAIKSLVSKGYIVIACGGGGVPVTQGKKLEFCNAVIDKDLTSQILATNIGASMLVILTDVDGVYENYNTKHQKMIKKIHVDKISKLLDSGYFEEGSMAPKVQAAVIFVKKTGKTAVITSLKNAKKAVQLKSGTIIYK